MQKIQTETIDRNRNDRTDYKNENIKKWKQIIKYENDNKKGNSQKLLNKKR